MTTRAEIEALREAILTEFDRGMAGRAEMLRKVDDILDLHDKVDGRSRLREWLGKQPHGVTIHWQAQFGGIGKRYTYVAMLVAGQGWYVTGHQSAVTVDALVRLMTADSVKINGLQRASTWTTATLDGERIVDAGWYA